MNPPALKTVDRRALTAALTALPCALLNGNLRRGGGWLRLTGVIAEGAPRNALDRALAEYSPRMRPQGMVQSFRSSPDDCWMLDGRTRLLADEVIHTAIDLLHKRGGHLDAAAIVLQTGPR